MYRPTVRTLACLAILTGLTLNVPIAHAQTTSGDITVDGVVSGPPPATAPTIEEPAPNTTFSTKSATIKGSCIAGLIVKVYRNNFFAGSALCQPDGTYSLSIDLFVGENTLVTRQFDSSGQASPDSNTVAVFYTPQTTPVLPDTSRVPIGPGPALPPDTPAIAQFQLIIDYDYTLQSIYTGTPFYLPVKFTGGTGPYAVNVNWGDGTNDVFSRNDTEPFTIDHTYQKAGYYTVTIKVSDSKGEQASLQFVLLASGKPDDSLIGQPVFPIGQSLTLGTAALLGAGALALLAGVLFTGYRWGMSRSKKV
ncbi:PKD domain-containing protein [Streptomyces caniscabiei]|uniref:PKD domain-containing protein n=1 Tax=Streptomyces caniscabiei TaxID=2746961 RepID=UPI0029B6C2E2|nr:PKD domain-containing protein [Streptomyces caniscabiei]MDX2776455.1 PKD domain-containing protein [Streptomyces caniscabiei]